MYDHLDTMGEDLAVVGATAPAYGMSLARRASMARRPFAQAVASVRPEWLGLASEQGVSLPQQELDFLPFDAVTLDKNTQSAELRTFPQRPFRGERLIIQATYLLGGVVQPNGIDNVVISPAIYVGAVQVGATQGSTPASTFAATAFGVRLSLPTAGQGTRITIPVSPTFTLGDTDVIKVSATIIGRAVR